MPGSDLVDDGSISDENPLWRRIPPMHLVRDGQGNLRPSSAAFKDHPNGSPMSVFIFGVESSVEATLGGHSGFGIGAITAGLARQNNQGVRRDPLADHPDHGEVFGKKTDSVRKSFARNAVWIRLPAQAD
jgi:hypothetical protein